jgi:hypothetical protein
MCQGVSINTKQQHIGPKGIQHEIYTPLIATTAHGQTDLLKNILNLHDIDIDAVNLIGSLSYFS